MKTALFLLPTDRMGGAENVIRLTAGAAIAGGAFDRVRIFVLAGTDSGTLDDLKRAGACVTHSGARSEKAGLPALVRAFARERTALTVSSHTHLNAAASAARMIGLLRTDRLVARESTMTFERDLGRIGPLVRGLYRLYGAQDRIVCQTERMARSLAVHTGNRFADRTEHIPNPLGVTPRTCSVPTDEVLRIVWCGRLAPVKSPERAVEALAVLRTGGTDARLTMIGDGPLRSQLEALAGELAVNDHVTFTGRLAKPVDAMASARIGLVTSDVEGFPNVILEMLAAGVPRVVTTDCAGGLADVPGVDVVPDAAPATLAKAIELNRDTPAPSALRAYLEARSPDAFLRAVAA